MCLKAILRRFRRNTAALTNSDTIVLIRLRKRVSIQTGFCTIRVNAVRSTRTNAARLNIKARGIQNVFKGDSSVGPTHISDSLLRRCFSVVSVRSFQ